MTDRDLSRDFDPELALELGLVADDDLVPPGLAGAELADAGWPRDRARGPGAHRHSHGKPSRAGRGAEQRPAGGRRKGRRGRNIAALLVVLTMLGGLGAGIWYGGSKLLSGFGDVPDYPGSGTGEVTVLIMPGDTASDVANTLAKAGVVKSPKAFVAVAEKDPRSTSLQPGTYRLRKQMKASAALNLLFDPASRLLARVTIPEGFSAAQILTRIAAVTKLPLAQLQAAAADTAKLGIPAYAHGKLEGFLYPATYDIEPGMSPLQILQMMVAKFDEVSASSEFEAKAATLKLSPYEVLIIASLVQEEGRVPSDMPKIARVIYNRLAAGTPLAVDASILYGLGRTSGELTAADLARNTPYNNRQRKGLPPTPIASPGLEALEAALAPAPGNWTFYVLMDKQGHQFFTNDYEAFVAQKAKSKREGVFK
ncbi:MAG: endolytic transglycosylase MltG [Jatrophihabitantaceae bacterium]